MNKSITHIAYNHLNLPTVVELGSNKKIEWTYDGAGTKLQKTAAGVVTDYLDGYQYENEKLQFFPHAEGYAAHDIVMSNGVETSRYTYVYRYTDHLGNIRLSYTDANGNGTIDKTEIIEENNYYPFGLKHKGYNNIVSAHGNAAARKYLYQGQELQNELELSWYSFKYRNYIPELGRFFSIDPLTEEYHTWSPYVFSGNYVINARELEGLEPVFFYELAKLVSPVAINFSGKIGTHGIGIGVNVSVGMPQALSPYSERREYGVTYYHRDAIQGKPVLETRRGIEKSYAFGLVTQKSTSFNSGETSQTVGKITVGIPGLNIKSSNDHRSHGGDGGDRYRTAAGEITIGMLKAGFELGTGDPGLDNKDRKSENINGNDTYMPNLKGDNPDKFRLGIGYVGVGLVKVGVDSEKGVRGPIQNTFHDIKDDPKFRVLDKPTKPYTEISY